MRCQSYFFTMRKQAKASKSSASKASPKLSRQEIKEAARILKSGSSKKRERREAASVMSTVGSSKGGQARARNLTPAQRSEIARLGGLARQAAARAQAEELSKRKRR